GTAGEIVNVKDGYARNYLIPKGYGFLANEKNIKELEFHKRVIEKKINTESFTAKQTAEKLAECEIRIEKKVGEEGKLFGSVTTREIEEALKEKGFDIDHRNILVDGNIKKSGVYDIGVKLFREIKGVFKLWVVAEDSGEVFESDSVESPAAIEQEQPENYTEEAEEAEESEELQEIEEQEVLEESVKLEEPATFETEEETVPDQEETKE
ncbi:MAG TPA: 50S ribosomal protein L9, partial [bacterium]|nr:50S ribosomal protein L9 [bacterium]